MSAAIDWGNTNTVIAFTAGNREHLVEMNGQACVPSYMQYDDAGNLLRIGRDAKDAARSGKGNVIAGLKRLIGASYSPLLASWAKSLYGLELRPSAEGGIQVRVGRVWRTPEEMASEFFRRLHRMLREQAKTAESWLARLLGASELGPYLATCPVQYNDMQKAALRACLEFGDFRLHRDLLLPEPAAVGNLLGRDEKAAFIIHWGGGTLDFAFISAEGECRGLAAIHEGCGGIDMDLTIMAALSARGGLPEGLSPQDRSIAREHVEARKEQVLSAPGRVAPQAAELPGLQGEIVLDFQREEVLEWIEPICRLARDGVEQTLRKHRERIERCVLVGGPFQAEPIQSRIRQALPAGCEVVGLEPPANAMTAVAVGAVRTFHGVSPVGPVFAHDYGVMVECLDYQLGVLLLREGQPYPAESPERELELRGSPGRLVPITIFVRRINPGTAEQTYESSASFLFMPRFTEHRAKIRVSLAADASGVMTVRVVDLATERAVELQKIDNLPSRPMSGPPCRSLAEAAGLLMLHCWQDFCVARGYVMLDGDGGALRGLEMPDTFDLHDLEPYLAGWVEHEESTLVALWNSICRMARDSQRMAQAVEAPSPELSQAVGDVTEAILGRRGGDVEPSEIERLCGLVDELHTRLIQSMGKGELAAALRGSPEYQADPAFAQRANQFLGALLLFEGTSANYEDLVARSSEMRNALLLGNPGSPALRCLDRLVGLLRLREPLQGLRDALQESQGPEGE